jgi:hypothetical protein
MCCKVLAIVLSADNSLMSQKFEIILKTVYSDRIGRRIAETNIRSVWRHISTMEKNTNVCYLYCQPTMETNTNVSLQSINHLNKYQRSLTVSYILR